MFHLAAFATSSPGTYSSLTNIAPATDPVAAISGNFLYVPTLNNLLGVYGLGTNLQRLQLSSPSLLADVPFDVTPVDTASVPSATTVLALQQGSPIPIVIDEPLQATVTTGGTAAVTAGVFLSDGAVAPVNGKIIHARGTITTGTSQVTWSNSALTLTNQLAEGNYNLVGARIEGSHGRLARFVFPGANASVRPGMPFSNSYNGIDADYQFRNGALGVWGTFSNRVLPTIDTLTDGTSETATVILDLIKQ